MKLALAIASGVILVVHVVVFYDQFFHKWERHQTAYFDQARTQARNDAERAERVELFEVRLDPRAAHERC